MRNEHWEKGAPGGHAEEVPSRDGESLPRLEDGGPTTWPYEGEPTKAPPLEPGYTLLGRYTVLGTLGQGSMGVVLSVYDARLDRRVALKLLRPWSGGESRRDEEQARFVREAQAMARLSHPQVVAVYDAGTLEDGALFIAMEYVEGQTLHRWQQGRPWGEVLAQYLAAGQGLAAAHEAGLIHHDFKPDNVLVGQDGRARVTDFGLAWLESASVDEPREVPAQLLPAQPAVALAALTTRSSQWMGTPSYMADEQFRGQRGDARSDLYAFCVSLYEGLYGQLPFQGNTVAELRAAQRAGRVEPPEDSQVPAWVTRTLLQGLSTDPAKRPSSMKALLHALADDPEKKRRARPSRWALVGAVGAAAGLALWVWARPQEQVCGRMELRLSGVWDAAVRARLEQGLVATGAPYARATAERVVQGLEAYAGAWVRQRTALCLRASQEGRPKNSGLLVLEEACLERRRGQLRALTELLSQSPDTPLVSKAVEAVQALPPLEYCEDAKALTAAVPPPEDPVVRGKVEALQQQVDSLRVLLDTHRVQEGLALADSLLPQVKAAGHASLEAQTRYLMAWMREGAGDYRATVEGLRESMAVAARGRDAYTLAQASNSLVWVTGNRLRRPHDALHMVPMAQSMVELADDDRIRAFASNSEGTILMAVGKHEQARQAFEHALALRKKVWGPEHWEVASTLHNLGLLFQSMGRVDEALEAHTLSLELRKKVLGPEHPRVAESLRDLGTTLQEMGRFEEALEAQARALALKQKVLGSEHPSVADSIGARGHVLRDMGRAEEALEAYARVLELNLKLLGPESPLVAWALTDQGEALVELGRHAEAREKFTRAMAFQDKVLAPDDLGRLGPLLGMGRLCLAEGKPAEAVPFLEGALKLTLINERARVQFPLARALWDSHGDRARAIELATQARDYWSRVGRKADAERASQWLKQHATSRP
ncbi:tetratricopeptide repeat protein [Pyxidicoccus xibeiensis]|uniref:serine/threonine-protein kinase n=1 Tax=Pyxidicoccus xibeiensis TaxID=2906759 RepID=UPI0020A80321|nr:serine/threonine-protein kinase [Pyxidicoccus xibeiensis]MCP3140562.1 serine/threonine-protein kinase [Pyxidicoccus xibeiensis]